MSCSMIIVYGENCVGGMVCIYSIHYSPLYSPEMKSRPIPIPKIHQLTPFFTYQGTTLLHFGLDSCIYKSQQQHHHFDFLWILPFRIRRTHSEMSKRVTRGEGQSLHFIGTLIFRILPRSCRENNAVHSFCCSPNLQTHRITRVPHVTTPNSQSVPVCIAFSISAFVFQFPSCWPCLAPSPIFCMGASLATHATRLVFRLLEVNVETVSYRQIPWNLRDSISAPIHLRN